MAIPLEHFCSWNDSLHFCQWPGVTCGRRRHQRVTVLNLQNLDLLGTISPYIGNLTFLQTINLQNNSFHGAIPQEVGHLFRLHNISVNNNTLEGEIPTNLTHCYNLRVLDVKYNNLNGKIPRELGSLSKLTSVYLRRNYFIGPIPASLGNLSSLRDLAISENGLEGNVPEDLGRLTHLTFLSIHLNNLSGMLPNSLYNISSLKIISASDNQMHGSLPPDIGLTLPNLSFFSIASNRFTGGIPVTLLNISKLETFDINDNRFGGTVPTHLGVLRNLHWLNIAYNGFESDELSFLASLANCSYLRVLNVNDNMLRGSLPSAIANLSIRLEYLALGGNQISGSIPTEIGNLISLLAFGVEENFLTGKIPPTVGKLQNLNELSLRNNRFFGLIPSSICNITFLYKLDLGGNKLGGRIPSSLGNCQNLQALKLDYNNLSGTIPKPIFGLSTLLTNLSLAHNSFSGSLPLEIGKLQNIGFLDVSENKLSGEIPTTIGDCFSLEYLSLEGNFFNGTIPLTLGSLKGIRILDLSRNNLSGWIPEDVENLAFLESMNLSFNNLEGEVPTKGVFANPSIISVVGNDKLCGGITELHLPICSSNSTKRRKSSNTKVLISITTVIPCCFLLLLCFLIILYWKRNSKRKPSDTPPMNDHQLLKVSYKELFQATGGFSMENLIGSGSFGFVYKGILSQGTIVAVKVLNLQRPRATKSFMAECNALINIRHRNLVKLLTCCSSLDIKGNDFKALVFHYVPNGSLDEWLHLDVNTHRGSLDILQRLNIAIDVATALDYLHHHCQTPIVHCDLKPSNVLLDNDMTAHISDFGLAKLLLQASNDSCSIQTSSFRLKGTIGYTPPEYGTSGEVSTHGDVYSYGILLLEMFTGRRPTDEMFRDDFNLHKFAKTALSEQAEIRILDPTLLLTNHVRGEIEDEATTNFENLGHNYEVDKTQECITSVLKIGVQCSAESPRERIDMSDVVRELIKIKEISRETGVH